MEMTLLKNPPMIPTDMTPSEIVGFENIGRFASFLKICFSPANKGEFPDRQLDKEMGTDNRKKIADTMLHLRKNGFYPLSVDKDNNIKWGIVVKSSSHMEMEKGLGELKKIPKEKHMEMCRKMLNIIGKIK